MATPIQARVGSEGGGDATVFDTSQFYTQMYNIQKDVLSERDKKKKELERQQKTWNALLEDPGDVWQADYEYVNKAVNEYNDYIIDLRSQGIDPETMDANIMRKMKRLEGEIRKATSAAKENKTYSDQSFNILNQDKQNKYNKDYATDWLKKYADPKLTPQDRAKMRIESNPFKVNYDLIEFTKNTIPEKEVIVGKDKKTTQRNREAHRAVVLDYVMNDPQGQDVYESLKKPNETELEFSERVAAKGQELFPVNEEPIKKGTSKGSSSGTSSSSKTKKPTVKVQSRDTDTLDNNGQPKYDQSLSYNKLLLDNTPPVYVVADDGTTRVKDFIPSGGFKIRPDGHVEAVGEGKSEADNSLVEVTINYGKNQDQFNIAGYPDMFVAFQKGKKDTGSKKTIKRSEIQGKATAAGYKNVAEYEAILKKNGVTITED
jgi:hypothetical protein